MFGILTDKEKKLTEMKKMEPGISNKYFHLKLKQKKMYKSYLLYKCIYTKHKIKIATFYLLKLYKKIFFSLYLNCDANH